MRIKLESLSFLIEIGSNLLERSSVDVLITRILGFCGKNRASLG